MPSLSLQEAATATAVCAAVALLGSAFFLAFFFSQNITRGSCSPSFWLDKLCVNQAEPSLKEIAIASFPVFLSQSSQMLVLWDEEYFGRLWCNLELAAFASSGHAPQKMQFVPAWLAPWLLASICTDMISVSLLRVVWNTWTAETIATVVAACTLWLSNHGLASSQISVLLSWTLMVGVGSVSYYVTALPTVVSTLMKVQRHGGMLEQMAQFDIREASCKVEADRTIVEEKIGELFEAGFALTPKGGGPPVPLESPYCTPLLQDMESRLAGRDPLESFNAYVRGPLRDIVLDKVGSERHVPYHLALASTLPMILYALVDLLSCSGMSCQDAAESMKSRSLLHFALTLSAFWLVNILLIFPVVPPILFGLLGFVCSITSSTGLRLLLGTQCIFLLFTYAFLSSGLVFGLLVLTASGEVQWLAPLLLVVALLGTQLHVTFWRSRQHQR
ncbi:unnamed protein product [Symbiodinium natans]|uniref:Uncharacterized protein n=1 Tax=Symbiodinium natans TaxID=878477 RepID=A0A812QMG8_9DINO|nr:unnamed protein product [Symbiodinium natans]